MRSPSTGRRAVPSGALAATFALIVATTALAAPSPEIKRDRKKALESFLSQERPKFVERESRRRSLLDELDSLNRKLADYRQRTEELRRLEQELTMASENLSLEMERETGAGAEASQRLRAIVKIHYRLRNAGPALFFSGRSGVVETLSRMRLVYRMLKSYSSTAALIGKRTARLASGEERLLEVRTQLAAVMDRLDSEGALVSDLETKKRKIVSDIDRQQKKFRSIEREYAQVARDVSNLFEDLETARDSELDVASAGPGRQTLPLPVEGGTLRKQFGRVVHKNFGTAFFHRGLEILAPLGTPVKAVLPGVVEHDGWVKGLGNVLILHHGGGFYSLYAYLSKVVPKKGQRVEKDTVIGAVGDSGTSDAPSLYFEVRENGRAVDPLPFLSRTAVASLR
jgi:murein DD-endopeptidase MepM/ murein hydrolase activator NlpD